MHIRRAQPNDAFVLTDIAFAAKKHWGYPESWIESWRPALTITPAAVATDEIHVAIVARRIVGFYALHQHRDKIELAHLWVLPGMMNRGIGRSLFIHAVERARDLGFRRITIESDPHAEGFYLRFGAQRTSTNVTQIEGQVRELPVLVYELG